MENSKIIWTHNTQNFWLGRDKIAPECVYDYTDCIRQGRRGMPKPRVRIPRIGQKSRRKVK